MNDDKQAHFETFLKININGEQYGKFWDNQVVLDAQVSADKHTV